MSRLWGAAEAVALVVAALVFFAIVGALNPLRQLAVDTDRLGPENGEYVVEYLDRAGISVKKSLEDKDLHWGLVSFDSAVSPAQSWGLADSVRISQVLLRVPLDRVQTAVITVGVSGTEVSVAESESVAASRLQVSMRHVSMGQGGRQSQIDAASAFRLSAGCDCVVGLVVRAPAAALATIAGRPGVRAVEALPSDAAAGRFAVRALLPDFVDVVGPLPDDGLVPPP